MKNGIIIAGVVAAIFAVAYFTSDVFSTKVDQAAKQWAKWTPENIQKDPAGYLAFAKTQLEKANDTLEAKHIALKTKQNEYKTKHTQAKECKGATWHRGRHQSQPKAASGVNSCSCHTLQQGSGD